MQTMNDRDLLRIYAREQSDSAFGELVRRHVNLVYSAALRMLHDPHLAEDVAQAVFIVLARKAGRLPADTLLFGWLLKATHYAANAQIRSAARRAQREQEAYLQSTLIEPKSEVWDQLAPVLDEAMASLGETDRSVLVLRFFENKTAFEIACALKMSEEAAQKCATRALEKLRKIFRRRGLNHTAVMIAGALASNSVQAAPVSLATTIIATAAKGAAISTPITMLVSGIMKAMTLLQIKFAAGVAMTIVLLGGTVALLALKEQPKDLRIVYLQYQREASKPITNRTAFFEFWEKEFKNALVASKGSRSLRLRMMEELGTIQRDFDPKAAPETLRELAVYAAQAKDMESMEIQVNTEPRSVKKQCPISS
jgi:RNA polymerase sigma factor (sigma-70 family)